MESYGRLAVWFSSILIVSLTVGWITSAEGSLPGNLGRFIGECFERNTRTLYLVGLETLDNFQSYLTLPYPKRIIPRGTGIGTPDTTSLVVLHLDITTKDALRKSMALIMQNVTKIFRHGKYLALVEDAILAMPHHGVAIQLGLAFGTYNIVYWCMTGFRRAESLQYTVPSALNIVFFNDPVQYGNQYSWKRSVWPNVSHGILAQAALTFPYTYSFDGGPLKGIDMEIFNAWIHHHNYQLHVEIIQFTGDTEKDRLTMGWKLQNMKADVMMTRKDVQLDVLPVVYVPSVSYYCMLVPRSATLNLTDSLLRPFSRELWICIIAVTLAAGSLMELVKFAPRIATYIRRVLNRKPLSSILSLSISIVHFILIESYLAKVTACFLIYLFQPDAKTLDEFFATGIPILLTVGHKPFLMSLSDDVHSRILERAVGPEECAKMPCAMLKSFARATYEIRHELPNDPVSGRKPFYIVPEMLIGYTHLAYAFAKGTSLADPFAVYLRRMQEAGLVMLFHRQYEQYLEPDRGVYSLVDESLKFTHIISVWISLGLGWVVSFNVFLAELLLYRLFKRWQGA